MDTARIWYIEKFRRRLGLVTNALQLLPLCQDQPAGRQSRCCNQLRWPYSTFWSGFHKRPKASGSCAKWGTERPGPYASVQSRLDRSNVTCVWPTTEVQHVHGATSPRPLWLLLWPRPCLARSQRANVWQIFETRRTDNKDPGSPKKWSHSRSLEKMLTQRVQTTSASCLCFGRGITCSAPWVKDCCHINIWHQSFRCISEILACCSLTVRPNLKTQDGKNHASVRL